jgi:hypothetical protein
MGGNLFAAPSTAIYGTGVVANLEAAMNAEVKKSVSPDEFVGKIVGMVEKMAGSYWPKGTAKGLSKRTRVCQI